MIFDLTTIQPCIVQPPTPPDPRCVEADYALQHPTCASALIIKPDTAMLCHLDSVVFSVFEFAGGVETELTSGVSFTSSDQTVFAIGVNSGSGTAIGSGDVIITATYGDRSVQATINAQAENNCCDEVTVKTAIVVDNSNSMGLTFGGDYAKRLVFAKAVATSYGGLIAEVNGVPKDSVEVWSVNSTLTQLLASSQDTAAVLAAIAGISQTNQKTDLLAVFTVAAQGLLATDADKPVLLLLSDCEVTVGDRQAVLDAAFAFKQAGGIVIVVAPRASGVRQGFDLAERVATGGFFINATSASAAPALLQLNYLKKLLCAGSCVDPGERYENKPALVYTFGPASNWEVVDGVVNLLGPGLMDFLPGNGLYVELSGQAHTAIGTIDSFDIVAGQTYLIHFKAAGNQQSQTASQSISVSLRIGPTNTFADNVKVFEQKVFPAWNDDFASYDFTFIALYDAAVRIYFEQNYAGNAVPGSLLDDVAFRNETSGETLLDDNFDGENLTYIPPACGMSAGAEGIDDPPSPVVTLPDYGESGDGTGLYHKFTYGYSWVTNVGETKVTPVVHAPVNEGALTPRRIDISVPPPGATAIRLWRSLGEVAAITVSGAGTAEANGQYLDDGTTILAANRYHITRGVEVDPTLGWYLFDTLQPGTLMLYSTAGTLFDPWDTVVGGVAPAPTVTNTVEASAVESAMFLIAELPVSETTYFDSETRAQFAARYEPSVTAPTLNTTAVAAGGLGYGYAPCCYYYEVGGETVPLVPARTGNDEASGIITSGTLTTLQQDWWWAFTNQAPLSPDKWIGECDLTTGVVAATEWIKFQFPEAKTVAAYSFNTHFSLSEQEPPYGWFLEGSNNDSDWTLLDTRNDVTDWVYAVDKTFSIASPNSFTYYRLTFTQARFGNDSQFTISGLQFYGGGTGVVTFENNCPVCLTEVPGLQVADSPGLADIEIESGSIPPTVFTCVRAVDVGCPTGFANAPTANIVPVMTSATAPSGTAISSTGAAVGYEAWRVFDGDAATFMDLVGTVSGYVGYHNTVSKIATSYKITARPDYTLGSPRAWTFEGSNDGASWTVLDTRANINWFAGQIQTFVFTNAASFTYYRLNVTANFSGNPSSNLSLARLEIFGAGAATAHGEATGTGSTPDAACADATAKATAIAIAQLTCVQVFTDTVSAQRTPCPLGTYGGSAFTASASATSYNSQQEAHDLAQAAAQALADADRDCTQSNNDQQITIADNAVAVSYPSVKYVSGLEGAISKVTLTLCGLSHASPDDLEMLLVSPAGTKVKVWQNAGGSTPIVNVTIVLDDDAASALPDATTIVAGTYRPANYSPGTPLAMLSPAPPLPYEQLMSVFDGEDPNGNWALWIFDDLVVSSGQLACGWDLTISVIEPP